MMVAITRPFFDKKKIVWKRSNKRKHLLYFNDMWSCVINGKSDESQDWIEGITIMTSTQRILTVTTTKFHNDGSIVSFSYAFFSLTVHAPPTKSTPQPVVLQSQRSSQHILQMLFHDMVAIFFFFIWQEIKIRGMMPVRVVIKTWMMVLLLLLCMDITVLGHK